MKIEKSDMPTGAAPTRSFPRPLLLFLGAIILIAVVSLLVYRLPIQNPFTRAVVSVIPYPAAMINGTIISLHDYANEYDALSQYLQSTGYKDLPSPDVVRQTILDALMNKAAIRELAFRAGIKIDQARVEQFYQEVVQGEESEEAFIKELDETFGWTSEQFKKRIIESIVLALQMSEYVLTNPEMQTEPRAQIEQELAQPGTLPETDFGFVPVSGLPSQWSGVIQLPLGERSEILQTERDYALLRVVEEKMEGEEKYVLIKGVVVPKKTLEDVVQNYLADANVRYFVN